MTIRNEKEREALREGGRLLATILKTIEAKVAVGISTAELDAIAAREMKAAGAEPAFLNYHGFPAVLCTSLNTKVVHGIPSADEILRDGDIIGIDIGIRWRGLYTDMAVTVGAGTITREANRLIQVTRTALEKAVACVHAGATTGDIGAAVQTYVEEEGFGVVRDLVGHGVGRKLHEEPVVPNFGIAGRGTHLTEGMVIAIEPMVTAGSWHVKTLEDGWSVVTVDDSLAAHFEHTVVVTKDGCDVVTVV